MALRDDELTFPGRVLYLTEDVEALRAQLDGVDLDWDPSIPLRNNISTDEITPGWVCFHYDETLGRYALVGLEGGAVTRDAIRDGGFSVLVSGRSKGCGSSRETAPFAELAAGVGLIVAESIEKIYGQNCQNIGLLTTTDFGVLDEVRRGQPIALERFTRGLDVISADIVRFGGLFAYNRARLGGEVHPPAITTASRPMTLVEKIIAAHAVTDAKRGSVGLAAVAPGDALFVRADLRFAHEYVTPMADALMRKALGDDVALREPEGIVLFRDHLTFIGEVMPEERRKLGLLDKANGLAATQAAFADRHGVRLYGERSAAEGGGSEAICHNAVVDDLALPGQVVVGTDSHTCMAGVLGCFAFGVGSTDMANAWYTGDVRVKVPESVRVILDGTLRDDATAKDVMLYLLAQPFFAGSEGIGKVLEFGGAGAYSLPVDERATLTNMAVEAGGFTGIMAADERIVKRIVEGRGLSATGADAVRAGILYPDEDATYAHTLHVNLDEVGPMVAEPGDPRRGVALEGLERGVRVDIAYGGSCTGGKRGDMDLYARAFRGAAERGETIADGTRCYIQYGSQDIRAYAEARGYDEIFRAVGADVLAPSCGACINAGPGASSDPDTVTVSAQNRNFPGRSGPGKVWLASPLTVAASALAGRLVPFSDV